MFARATARGAPASFAIPPSSSPWSRFLCLCIVDPRDGQLRNTQAHVLGPRPSLPAVANDDRVSGVALERRAGADVLQMVLSPVSCPRSCHIICFGRLNTKLEANGHPPMSSLVRDLSDGVRLIQLMVSPSTRCCARVVHGG